MYELLLKALTLGLCWLGVSVLFAAAWSISRGIQKRMQAADQADLAELERVQRVRWQPENDLCLDSVNGFDDHAEQALSLVRDVESQMPGRRGGHRSR